jgi:hypothetical protein
LKAVGTPPGNDLNAFFNSTDFGANFLPTSDPAVGQAADFSMGVLGTFPGGPVGGFSHQLVVTFPSPVTVESVAVSNGVGTVASFDATGNVVTVNLTDVTNAQRLGVTLVNVCNGTIAGNILIPMGVLAGDVSNNGTTNGSDVAQAKAQSGATVTGSNFRNDVNANGSINGTDVGNVKSKSGTVLPP